MLNSIWCRQSWLIPPPAPAMGNGRFQLATAEAAVHLLDANAPASTLTKIAAYFGQTSASLGPKWKLIWSAAGAN